MSTPKSIRDNIITQAASMLACYRKNCAQASTAAQMILPDTMKLLPIYTASLIKCDALIGSMCRSSDGLTQTDTNVRVLCLFVGQTVTTDDRSWLIHRLTSMSIKGTSAYIYPRIYPLVCTHMSMSIIKDDALYSSILSKKDKFLQP